MTFNSRSIFLVFLIFVFVFPSAAQTGKADAVDRYLSKKTEMGAFSGAVLIVKDGKPVIRKGYGFADVENKIPYTSETRHAVASITKMFTSMAALILRDRGKLKLEDSVCIYLSDCPDAWKPVTIQHLMRHTSGIPDYEEKLELGSEKYLEYMAKPNSSDRIIAEAKKLPLDFAPGEKFNYSNTAYNVLSVIIGKVAGESYEEFVTKNILKPAGMKTAGFLQSGKPIKNLAVGYSYGSLPWEKTLAGVSLTDGHLKKQPLVATGGNHGDGSLYMTVDDLYAWSRVMDGKDFVSEKVVREVFTPGLSGYGYGWFIGKGFDRDRVRHNGALPGYISNFDKYTTDNLTIILFCNQDHARLSAIARDIAAIMLDKPWDMPVSGKVIKLSPEQVSALEGQYKTSDGATLTVKNEPDFLTASIPSRYTAGLIPLSPTEFYFPLADGRAIFTLGTDGKAIRVNMRYSGEDHVAERVQKP